nr:SDR family oxidoreductase [Rhizobacter sp. SG703]
MVKTSVSNSIAIVTGASSGIGKATALRLAKDHAGVVLVARRQHELEDVARQVRAAGAQALVVAVDLAQPDAAEAVVAAALQAHGRIDAVVHVAGAVPGLDVFAMTDAQWDAGMALKFHGARRLTLRAWDALRASSGAVVFVSGNAADAPKASMAAIGAINAGIEALAKAFAERGIADGIQVNSVSPGSVMTGRRLGMIERQAEASGIALDDAKAAVLRQAGIRRFGEADEIAGLIAFVVSPGARWMTGTVLRIDGGEIRSV